MDGSIMDYPINSCTYLTRVTMKRSPSWLEILLGSLLRNLLDLVTPPADETHRPSTSDHLSDPPLILPSKSRLCSRFDLAHLRQVAPDEVGIDGFVDRIDGENVERVGLARFGSRRSEIGGSRRSRRGAEERVGNESGRAVSLQRERRRDQ